MKCDYCESRDHVISVNGRLGCADHIDDAIAAVFAPLRESLEKAQLVDVRSEVL